MTNFRFYFAVLLLTWNWRTGQTMPIQSANNAQCASLFKSLLLNITELRGSEVLCHGLIPSSDTTVRSADTVQACAPNMSLNSSCVMQRDSSFNEVECLGSIKKDLVYHKAAIQYYIQSDLNRPNEEIPLLRPTLGIIQSLMENCSLMANGENSSFEKDAAKMWTNNSFHNRQKMCKMMRGFYVRAITINRAMGYISSGDHRK